MAGAFADSSKRYFSPSDSGPRVRGRPAAVQPVPADLWTTPRACGTTRRGTEPRARRSDHPRRSGDDYGRTAAIVEHGGPPLSVRGRLVGGFAAPGRVGTTLARAGTTTPAAPLPHLMSDHPRACGETGHPADVLVEFRTPNA